MRLYESGICEQLQKKYLDDKYLDPEKRPDSHPDVFNVQHLFGGWLVLFLGLMLSVIRAVYEHQWVIMVKNRIFDIA
jgi:hypothetical protein